MEQSTTETAGQGYDDSEAIRLLDQTGEEWQPDHKGAAAAATALLKSLLALSGKTAVLIESPGDGSVSLVAFDRRVFVAHKGYGELTIGSGPKGRRLEEIKFNRTTGRFEGSAYPPKNAWDPPRYRSALAVVVEQALKLIDEVKGK